MHSERWMIYRYSSKRRLHTHTYCYDLKQNSSFPIGLLRFVSALIHMWILKRRTWHATSPKCTCAQKPLFPHYLLRWGSLEGPDFMPPALGCHPRVSRHSFASESVRIVLYHLGPTPGFQSWTPRRLSEQALVFRELSLLYIAHKCTNTLLSLRLQLFKPGRLKMSHLDQLPWDFGAGKEGVVWFQFCGWIYSMYTGELPWWAKENWGRGREGGGGEEKGLVEFRALVPTMYSGLISLLFLYL